MGGEVPRTDPRLLNPSSAAYAANTDLTSGPLDGLPAPVLLRDMGASPGTVKRAYRFPLEGFPDNWLALPSPYSNVVTSPLTNDNLHRIYWTVPTTGQPTDYLLGGIKYGAFWTTLGRIVAGDAPYDLGFTAPDPNPAFRPVVTCSGGTLPEDVPWVARTYLVTFVDIYGQESSPGAPSDVVEGASDGIWKIDIPQLVTSAPAHKNYPPVAFIRLYRTVVGQNTGAQFYETFDYIAGSPVTGAITHYDGTFDQYEVGNRPLGTTGWAPPPADLDGLISMPGGFLAGFSGNTVHFSEPNRPHAWPPAYDLSVRYQIVSLALWNGTLLVLTEGCPSTGSGMSPAAVTLSEVPVHEPCISRGSIVTDLQGVCYASQNGLVILSLGGLQNLTQTLIDKQDWLDTFKAREIVACRHRNQYIAVDKAGTGFMIDATEARLGLVRLDPFVQNGTVADCVWNDPYTGDCYMMAGKKVYVLDRTTAPRLAWRWRSKIFEQSTPLNLGAAKVILSPAVLNTPPGTPTDLSANSLVNLPGGVNCLFRLWVDGELKWEKPLTKVIHIFRLPSGFKGFEFQFELVSRVPVYRVTLADTMKALRGGGGG